MRSNQTWLILSHAFNMDGRAASQTITDKIPHLLARGVKPIVLSAVTGRRDTVVEHHQLLPVSPAGLRFDLRYILRRHISSKPVYKLAVALMTLLLLPFYILEKLFLRLEPQWSWFITAYFAGARIVRKRKPEVIYSTGGANSAHMAGYLLARRFSLPWVAEIHDPIIYENWERRRMAYRFAAWLERKICERADVVIWFVDTALERARKRHPVLANRGRVMIPGADQPAFGNISYHRGAELVIGHFGSLSPTRNLATFMGGLTALLQKRPDLSRVLRLEIYGSGLDPVSERAIDSFAYPEVVRRLGRLERDPVTGDSGRDRVLRRMRTVDALLLLHGMENFCEEYIPSKLYEYLWTQRPIIGLTWRNPHLDRILKEGGHWVVPTNDQPGIASALEELVARWEANQLQDSGKPSPYTSAAAVDQLYAWVQEAVKNRAALAASARGRA
jgi:glycosyltransferase involved in cell wall biosynthesis